VVAGRDGLLFVDGRCALRGDRPRGVTERPTRRAWRRHITNRSTIAEEDERMPEKGAKEHVEHVEHKVNLNTATEEELAQVSDIGTARARKIVEHREQHGKFESVDELDEVEGFGKTLTEDERDAFEV
jgi:comEA protein